MESPEVIRNTLAQAIGTLHYWKIFPGDNDFKITDGVKSMAGMCEAYWLLTAIFTWLHDDRFRGEGFIVWKLNVEKDQSAWLIADNGNGKELLRDKIFFRACLG